MNTARPRTDYEIKRLVRHIGTLAPVSIGGLSIQSNGQTGDYTVTTADDSVFIDATSAAVTVTLPPAADVSGKVYTIKKVDAGANAVTVDADGSETIDGGTTVILNAYDAVTVQSDGTEWWII